MRRAIDRARSDAGRRRSATPFARFDPGVPLALLALAAFLAVAMHAPLHRHGPPAAAVSAAATEAGPAHSGCSHGAPDGDRSPAGDSGGAESDPHCPFCQLAGEARAPLPAEPIAPPRSEETAASVLPPSSAAPTASILLAARPRAPPAFA